MSKLRTTTERQIALADSHRQMHTRHLQLLREGLLLTDVVLLGIIREIIDTCKRLAGLVERWGGDAGSATLGDEEVAREMDGRLQAVQEVKRVSFEGVCSRLAGNWSHEI